MSAPEAGLNTEQDLIDEYLKNADAYLDSVKSCFSSVVNERLACVFELTDAQFGALKSKVDACIEKTLRLNGVEGSHPDLYQRLYAGLDNIANLTPNGSLIYLKELIPEVNALQREVVDLFQSYGAGEIFEYGQCPVNIRVSEKARLEKLISNPFASLKWHTDVWAGEPIDQINFLVPIYVDAPKMNIEVIDSAPETDGNTLKVSKSYDHAITGIDLGEAYDIAAIPGTVCIMDPRAVHRTTFEPLRTIRVSMDFRFRLKLPKELRACLEKIMPQHVHYQSYDFWREIGRTKIYDISESFREYTERIKNNSEGTQNHRYNKIFSPRFVDA